MPSRASRLYSKRLPLISTSQIPPHPILQRIQILLVDFQYLIIILLVQRAAPSPDPTQRDESSQGIGLRVVALLVPEDVLERFNLRERGLADLEIGAGLLLEFREDFVGGYNEGLDFEGFAEGLGGVAEGGGDEFADAGRVLVYGFDMRIQQENHTYSHMVQNPTLPSPSPMMYAFFSAGTNPPACS